MTKFCPACGEALVDNAKFCKRCGERIDAGAPKAEVPERPLIEKSYTLAIVIGYIGAILIPIVGLIIAIYLMTRKDSQKAKRHGIFIIVVAVVVWIFRFLTLPLLYR